MPHYLTARPRRLVGGHVIGLVCGIAAYYVFLAGPLSGVAEQLAWFKAVAAGISVGLSVLLMPVFNAEHPPAAGTALGIAVGGWRIETIIFVMIFAVSLAVVRSVFSRRLRDLV
jgi:CBS-domain-containing membrane protein